MIRGLTILTVMTVFISCKKQEDYIYDREEGMELDTVTYFMSAEPISSTASELTVRLRMVTFNGLENPTFYPENLYDSIAMTGYSFDFSNVSTYQQLQAPSYSTVLAFNEYNRRWFNEHHISFYLRRYLEQIDDIDQANAGIVIMDHAGSNPTNETWHTDAGDSLFSVSWNYAIQRILEKMSTEESYSAGTISSVGGNVKVSFSNMIDDMLASPDVLSETSITVFTDYDYTSGIPSDSEIDDLVNKAKTTGTRINFIGPEFSDLMIRYASETGGFMCEYRNYVDPAEVDPDNPGLELAAYVQNLHRIVAHDVWAHQCNLVITDNGAGPFVSGDRHWIKFIYDDKEYAFSVVVP